MIKARTKLNTCYITELSNYGNNLIKVTVMSNYVNNLIEVTEYVSDTGKQLNSCHSMMEIATGYNMI